jgi:hypothetical protein
VAGCVEEQTFEIVRAQQSGDDALAYGLERNLAMLPHAIDRAVNAQRFLYRCCGTICEPSDD